MNIRIIDEDKVEIEGYVNAVERLSKPITDRLGRFLERIKAGAFARALKRADDVRIWLNHDECRDLGGIKDGNLELHEDAIGLHARATITDKDVCEMARSGDLVGWSFGFRDIDVEKTEENGFTVRNVNDLVLKEVSLINRDKIPAYDGTLVSVRSNDETLNISEVTEFETRIIEEEQKEEKTEEAVEETVEERTEEKTDNEPAQNGAVDYTKYHNIINEMKGDSNNV